MEPEQETDRRVNSKIHYLDFAKKSSHNNPDMLGSESNKQITKKNSKSKSFAKISEEVKSRMPSFPLYCMRPHAIKKAVEFFRDNFTVKSRAEILYSVKSNPDSAVLNHLFNAGIRHFDVASLAEIHLVSDLFGKNAKMYFMHPIKSFSSIAEAYFDFGIRDFSLDSFDELEKIVAATKGAKDLGLHIRLAIPNSHSAIDLSGKFGILPSEATSLLRKARTQSKKLGVCFHVGSQCMDPIEYRSAISIAKDVIDQAQIKLDVLDIGGGFPASYPTMTPPPMQSYFDEIVDSLAHFGFDKNCQIWCEPGRALVADSTSLVVRVEARKGNMLYINDGTYGGLFDAGHPGFIYPAKAMRFDGIWQLSDEKIPFGFYGPTCDSLDVMKGPFYLPENIEAGDYIEIGQLGAYSRSIRTAFNGFDKNIQIEVSDLPLVSLYEQKKPNHKLSEKKISK